MEDKSGWERGAGANDRSAKRGNRTVLDCVAPKVWVKEESDEDKKGGWMSKNWSDGVEDSGAETYPCHRLASLQLGFKSLMRAQPGRAVSC